jgi:hypothetical protein
LYSRWKFTSIGADDIAATLAYIFYVGLVVATLKAMDYGLGIRVADVNYLKDGINLQKCGFSSLVLYPVSLGFVKLSILLFLSRVVPETSSWKLRIYFLAAFVVCLEIAFTLVLAFQCRPVAYYWDKELEGTCINQHAFYYVEASINIGTDVVILSIPWLIFSSLRVPRQKKYALLAICSVGVFTLVTSIIRLPFLYSVNHSGDPTWAVVDVVNWSIAEVGSAITTSSIPPIRPLITHIFPKRICSTDNTNTSSDGLSSFPLSIISIPRYRAGRERSKSYDEIHGGRDI